jgi:hypothetical protein
LISKKNKYNARKCFSTDGLEFDSKKERDRWEQLRIMQAQGKISHLERQRKFELIPNQRGSDGKVAERAINYIADFVYQQDGHLIVEDIKGYRAPQSAGYAKFVIKRKLMLWVHHIAIKEV